MHPWRLEGHLLHEVLAPEVLLEPDSLRRLRVEVVEVDVAVRDRQVISLPQTRVHLMNRVP